MASTNLTQELISVYADNEGWKFDHIEALLCCDVEEHLAWGVQLFEGLLEFESRLQTRASRGADTRAVSDLESLAALYGKWLKTSEDSLTLAKEFVRQGYSVAGLNSFEQAIEQARWICASAAIEAEMLPYSTLVEQLQPNNPDPARYGD